jgi:hypothetical protein
MRTSSFILILLAFLAASGCDDNPVVPKKKSPPPPDFSGTFLMADTLVSSTCQFPVGPGTLEDVTVWGDSIKFAGFYGSWDGAAKRGQGTDGPFTVPINPPDCWGYYTVMFDITFLDVDHFYGTWQIGYTYDVYCWTNPCSYLYKIGGTRQ